tara:strand:- start:424 stop:873 length:450 start_codon:yes stop_codon:yes gene_type:complete
MSKFKDICKGFFGLQEVINVSAEKYDAIKDKIDPEVEVNITETELEEAQLINNLSDYNGHVMYQLRDPQEANAVAKDIQRWTTKKGFTIIKHEKSTSGRTGYFYFRIGEDPGSESQKIQGYFAQLPELVKFAFKAPRSKQPKQMKRRKF